MSNMVSDTCNNRMGSYQKWFIGNDIRKILLECEEITEQVKTDIYPLVAPENVKGDFIIYGRDKYTKHEDAHNWVIADECLVWVTAIADNYDNAIILASNIDNTLTGKHTTDEGKTFKCELSDSSETFADNKYLETLIYKII